MYDALNFVHEGASIHICSCEYQLPERQSDGLCPVTQIGKSLKVKAISHGVGKDVDLLHVSLHRQYAHASQSVAYDRKLDYATVS